MLGAGRKAHWQEPDVDGADRACCQICSSPDGGFTALADAAHRSVHEEGTRASESWRAYLQFPDFEYAKIEPIIEKLPLTGRDDALRHNALGPRLS
jgi:hypothetical protein